MDGWMERWMDGWRKEGRKEGIKLWFYCALIFVRNTDFESSAHSELDYNLIIL